MDEVVFDAYKTPKLSPKLFIRFDSEDHSDISESDVNRIMTNDHCHALHQMHTCTIQFKTKGISNIA